MCRPGGGKRAPREGTSLPAAVEYRVDAADCGGPSLSLLAMSAKDQILGLEVTEAESCGGEPDDLGGKKAGCGGLSYISGLSGPLSGLDSLHSLAVSAAKREWGGRSPSSLEAVPESLESASNYSVSIKNQTLKSKTRRITRTY